MISGLKIIFRIFSYCYTIRVFLFFLSTSFLLFPQTKIDVMLGTTVQTYLLALNQIQSYETEVKNQLEKFERVYKLTHNARERQRSRELFAVSYLATSTMYAKDLISYIQMVIVNNSKFNIIPLIPLLSGIKPRIDYLSQQINLVQIFSVILNQKTHERGKILFIATVLINKLTRVIAELAEHLYKIKIRYKIIQCIFAYTPTFTAEQLNNLFVGTEAGFFDFINMLNVFQFMVEDETEDVL